MNQNLSPEAVKNNLMERGVTDADAETVVQNMLVTINKQANVDSSEKDKSGVHRSIMGNWIQARPIA